MLTTFLVDSLDDVVAEDGVITLREAIEAANTNAAIGDAVAGSDTETDQITFKADLFVGGPATIGLTNTPAEVAQEAGDLPPLLSCGVPIPSDSPNQLNIRDDLVIEGPGADLLSIDGLGQSRVFMIEFRGEVTISGVTITGGNADYGGGVCSYFAKIAIQDSVISENTADYKGGGVCVRYGEVSVTDCTFDANVAQEFGGGIYNEGTLTVTDSTFTDNRVEEYDGGGISNKHCGQLTVTNSTFADNYAYYGGGGIHNWATATVSDSTFTGNWTVKHGGAIGNPGTLALSGVTVTGNWVENGPLSWGGGGISNEHVITITNSTISDNEAGIGGGIKNLRGGLIVSNSSICNNTAETEGGGIWTEDPITVANSTIAGNRAGSDGGGIAVISDCGYPFRVDVINSTIVDNLAQGQGGGIYSGNYSTSLVNSVVAQNTASADADVYGTLRATSRNYFVGASDGNPMLTAITDDNGAIRYYLPQSGSPLIDAGFPYATAKAGLTTDQRGNSRFVPNGATVDIGSVEFQATPELSVAPTPNIEIIEGQTVTVDICLTADPGTAVDVEVLKQSGSSELVIQGVSAQVVAPTIVIYDVIGATTYTYDAPTKTYTIAWDFCNSELDADTIICGLNGAAGGEYQFAVTGCGATNTIECGSQVFLGTVTGPGTGIVDGTVLFGGMVDLIWDYEESYSANFATLSFDSTNWNVPQTVTFSLADDADRENDDAAVFSVSAAGMETVNLFMTGIDDCRTYVVDSLADVVAADGVLTLREAIEAASTNTAVGDAVAGSDSEDDLIVFDPALFADGPGVISLTNDPIDAAQDAEDLPPLLACGLPNQLTLADDLVIEGPGADLLSIDGLGQSQVFLVNENAEVTISGVTVTGGHEEWGGGIRNHGTLTLDNVVLSGNDASKGGAIANMPGAILTITESFLCDNSANDYGAAIWGYGVNSISISDSSFLRNSAWRYGGAIKSEGQLDIVDSTFVENSAGTGGAIYVYQGVVSILNSTFLSNDAYSGGGIHNYNGTITASNLLFSGNSAEKRGGAIENMRGDLTIVGGSLVDNDATNGGGIVNATEGSLTLFNTVVANNTANTDSDINGVCEAASTNNFIGTEDGDPMLTAIADENGLVRFYLPQLGSPLVDTGNDAAAAGMVVDQRGNPRFVGTVDIGSVELQARPELSVTSTPYIEVEEGGSFTIEVCLTADPRDWVVVDIWKLADSSPDISIDTWTLGFDSNNWNVPQSVTFSVAEDVEMVREHAMFSLDLYESEIVHLFVSSINNDNQVYVVDSLADTVAGDGQLTLREALEAVNTSSAVGDAPAGSEDTTDLIRFSPDLFGTGPAVITLDGSNLTIVSDVVIEGPGADWLTIDAGGDSRVFYVAPEADAFLSGLGITGGVANDGGGISNGGYLNLSDVGIFGNRAFDGGGGVYNFGTLSVIDSTIDGNLAEYGGGVYHRSNGLLTLVNSAVEKNTASSSGGGLFSYYGTAEIQSSLFSGNIAKYSNGGGIRNHLGTLAIANSTIAGNSASYYAGIENNGTLSVANSTISHNVAEHEGGGLNNRGDNTSTLINTVIAGNSASGFVDLNGGLTAESSHNFIGTEDGDPMLTAIADDEGVIRYYIPQLGSPLIDAGDDAQAVAAGLTVDVRGKERFVGTVDIGAVEFQGTPELAVSPSPFVEVIEGQTGSFLVCLTADPMGTVEVSVEKLAGGSDVTSVDQSALTFDSGNWNVPQSVSVLADNDSNLCEDSDIYALSCTGMDTVHLTVTSIDTMIRTYLVNSLEDTVALDGQLTLREALEAVNTGAAVGDALAGSEIAEHVITFAPSLFEAGSEAITLKGNSLEIGGDVFIEGPGAELLTIDAASGSWVFYITPEGSGVIDGLTITGGLGDRGGGIHNDGTLTVTRSTITGNTAQRYGGGFYNDGSITIRDSLICENHAFRNGGALDNHCATVVIEDCVIANNRANLDSGAIHNFDGNVTIDSSVLKGNTAGDDGGAISNYFVGTLSIINSTVSGNSAQDFGGAFYNESTLNVTNCSILDNVVNRTGGGIFNSRQNISTVVNTVVADNTAPVDADLNGGLTAESSHNFIGTEDGDPMLMEVADGDGLVQYYIPLTGSPLIDAGDNALAIGAGGNPLLTDQVGNLRVQNGTVDIGAYESVNAAPAVVQVKVDDGTQRSCVRGLTVQFSEAIENLSIESLRLTNLTTGETISINAMALPATTSPSFYHWTFPGFPGGRLPDGNYLAEIPAEGVVDADGAAMAEDYSFEFHSFFGDSDGDRDVDIADLFRFRKTYQKTALDEGFDGRFDSDSDGDVDLADFFAFRQNYKETLPAPVAIEGGIEGWSLPVSIPIFMNSSFATIPERTYGPIQRSGMKIGEPVSLKPVDFHAFSSTPAVAPSLAEEPLAKASIDEGLLTTLAIDLQQSRSTSKKNEEEASEDSPFALVYQWLD